MNEEKKKLTNVLISADPHYNHWDLAIFKSGKLEETRQVTDLALLFDLLHDFRGSSKKQFIVEDQYLKTDLRKKESIIKLCHAAGEITGIFIASGWKTEYTEPRHWKPAILKNSTEKREAEARFPGFKFKNEHDRDAALMAAYFLSRKGEVLRKRTNKRWTAKDVDNKRYKR